ncbi:TPA: GPW/gp25 family protein [Escherichia coli]|jgi:phage baseplate assembly protein W|uniref:Baseplate wedge protein n=7 Tax=root TaxID=1 RepID=A0A8S5UHL5_9CAUD|nr:GPW/gp25 family protein [Enterococcus faecium]ELG7156151.1 GPW/gp25 family protein [Staphylococcus aureus]DAF93976.1 MAG TPA: Baseplate wedge protein [Myoviridae sp. ctu2j3]HDH7442941.1 GPW/gp25 family protein [Escherichia coli]ELL1201421.1 GPW/gp25 family protein [Staphylococcus aureus]MDN3040694.1 GPW/gp25 family protein [Enterococcus faecium]
MTTPTAYQLDTRGAVWVDASSKFTLDTNPDLLPDVLAINNSLYNLFSCQIGARARIFQPEYGASLLTYLQEPIDQNTADKIQVGFIQAIARWEPRIQLDMSNTWVKPDMSLPGYQIRIAYNLNLNLDTQSGPLVAAFSVTANQS